MTAGELCRARVETIEKDATLADAARRMREFHVGDLVVVEDRGGQSIPLGILTDRDIVVSVAAQDLEHIQTLLVGDVVLPRLITARQDDSIHAVLKAMRIHGIRRLPVIDERGVLSGILTLDDLIAHIAEELYDLVQIISREQRRERETRQTPRYAHHPHH